MTKNEEYVNYALKNLEESLREALESEATPKEVYDAIVNEVERTSNYHRACLNTSSKVLSLLEDNLVVSDSGGTNVVSFNSVERKVTEAKNQSEWNDFFIKDGMEINTTDPTTWPDYTEMPDLTEDITINTNSDGDEVS